MKQRAALRMAVSGWIVFHLTCVLLVPNRMGAFYQWLAPVLDPYANGLEFAASWNFFAPEAGAAPLGFEWEWLDRSDEPMGRGAFPTFPDPYPFYQRERQNRRVTLGRFMAMDNARAEKMMGSYACRLKPEAHSLRLWKILYSIATVPEVVEGKRNVQDFVEKDRRMVAHIFCQTGLEAKNP